MEFCCNPQRVGFLKVHPFLAELIYLLPEVTDPQYRSERIENRLFPPPSHHPHLHELCADWHHLIVPELYDYFQSARQVVLHDLGALQAGITVQPPEAKMEQNFFIPASHLDAWLNVLNQARLTLAAQLDFQEERLNPKDPTPNLMTREGWIVFQLNVYAFMQQCLLDYLENT